MNARAAAVLRRFPDFLVTGDPDSALAHVIESITDGLDQVTRQVGEVRVAHRVGEAIDGRDVVALAGLHGLGMAALEPSRVRLADQPVGRVTEADRLQVQRRVLLSVIAGAARGNATSSALLHATAAYLGYDVAVLHHTADGWWHIAECRDVLSASVAAPDVGAPTGSTTDERVILALEENPFRPADIDPVHRRHGERFGFVRGGLDEVDVGVRIVGEPDGRTAHPMVVQLSTGRGLVFEGTVPDADELLFTAHGRVLLGERDVTGLAWEFQGGLFADAYAPTASLDFVFGAEPTSVSDQTTPERVATFAVSAPNPDAFATVEHELHGAARVGPLRMGLGESHWAAFVRLGHAGVLASPTASEAGGPLAAIASSTAAVFDGSVFGDAWTTTADVAGEGITDPALQIGFVWEEREPFAVRVLLPRTLAPLDDDAGRTLRGPVRSLLDRHRAAGVDLRVEYADPRWTLGTGVLRDTPDEALGTVLAGTELWPDSPAT